MKLVTSAIIDGKILDKYGKRGDLTLSMPFEFLEYPSNTLSFVLVIEDYDAIPVCGYDYVHWLVANITTDRLKENATILSKEYFVQGMNSNNESCYIGMAPPDKTHTYDFTLYALISQVNIKGTYDN